MPAHSKAAKPSTHIAVIGIDIGRNIFHLIGLDKCGAIVLKAKRSRGQCRPPLRAAPSRAQAGTEKRRSAEQRNCSRKEEHATVFGQDRHLPSRSGVPAGTMDWVRPQVCSEVLGLKPRQPPRV